MLGIISGLITAAIAVTKALTVIGLAVEGLKTVGNAVMGIVKALGIVKPERQIDDLGDRALQAEEDGIVPEKFESYEGYVRAIEEFAVDPERSRLYTEEDKVKKGIEVTTALTMERFPELPVGDFFEMAAKNPEYFNVARMDEIGKLAVKDGTFLSGIMNYISGTEKRAGAIEQIEDVLIHIEQTVSPEISDSDALDRVTGLRG